MKVIRKSVFETNSSSTHSICISKKDVTDFPKVIHFGFGEYGWENNEVWDTASYLYTAIIENDMEEYFDKIKNILDKHNILYTFVSRNNSKYFNQGYIDHSYELSDFINDICNNEDKLLRYLFGDSIIYTGNDNSNEQTDLCYSADEYIWDDEASCNILNPNYHADKYEYYFKGN
jgi:hypothetical protein